LLATYDVNPNKYNYDFVNMSNEIKEYGVSNNNKDEEYNVNLMHNESVKSVKSESDQESVIQDHKIDTIQVNQDY